VNYYASRNYQFSKKNAANLPLEEPMTITQNGTPAYIIESYEDRMRRDKTIALLKLASFSVGDTNNGRVISSADLKQRLINHRSNLKDEK
tara:strand:+ start:1187 stop:1456 length:270 start_codon:yes stop_codon:yes gene_type:complete